MVSTGGLGLSSWGGGGMVLVLLLGAGLSAVAGLSVVVGLLLVVGLPAAGLATQGQRLPASAEAVPG